MTRSLLRVGALTNGMQRTANRAAADAGALDGLSRHKYGRGEETLESRYAIQTAKSFDRVRSRRCRIRPIKGG